jgi:nucleotide-binding universal stress UspA family protein
MTRRILIPLDGSPEAEAIFPEVQRVLHPKGEVHLLHMVPDVTAPVGDDPTRGLKLQDRAQAYLEGARNRWLPGQPGLDLVRTGDSAAGILSSALEKNIDLIAMTTHGRSGIARMVLGSVAEQVVRKAQLPVLLTRPGRPRPTPRIRRILVPVEGEEIPASFLETVKSLATRAAAEIVLFHAVTPVPDSSPQWAPSSTLSVRSAPGHRLEELADSLEEEGLVAWSVVAPGEPAEAILAQIGKLEIDLIALSTHGRGGLERILSGSVAEQVLRHAPVAVLIQKPVVVRKPALLGERHE